MVLLILLEFLVFMCILCRRFMEIEIYRLRYEEKILVKLK